MRNYNLVRLRKQSLKFICNSIFYLAYKYINMSVGNSIYFTLRENEYGMNNYL